MCVSAPVDFEHSLHRSHAREVRTFRRHPVRSPSERQRRGAGCCSQGSAESVCARGLLQQAERGLRLRRQHLFPLCRNHLRRAFSDDRGALRSAPHGCQSPNRRRRAPFHHLREKVAAALRAPASRPGPFLRWATGFARPVFWLTISVNDHSSKRPHDPRRRLPRGAWPNCLHVPARHLQRRQLQRCHSPVHRDHR